MLYMIRINAKRQGTALRVRSLLVRPGIKPKSKTHKAHSFVFMTRPLMRRLSGRESVSSRQGWELNQTPHVLYQDYVYKHCQSHAGTQISLTS